MNDLKDIIRDNRMSTHPEYYSGRGATICDLNSDILQGIYLGIEKKFGKKQATAYVKMVCGIKVLSATTFLQELYNLFYNDWKYVKKKEDVSGIAIQKDEDGNYNAIHGMVSMFGAMSNNRDETYKIKLSFCRTHGMPIEMPYQSTCGRFVMDHEGNQYYNPEFEI